MRASQTQDSYWRGILSRKTPREQTSGYVLEALNIYFPGGIPAGRPGLVPFVGASFPADIKGHGWHVAEDGRRTLLVAAGTRIYRCYEGGDPIELPLDNLPTTKRTRLEPDQVNFLSLSGGTNTTYIYDGINTNLKFDGTLLTQMGIDTPPTPHAITTEVTNGSTPAVPRGTRSLVQSLTTPHHESSPSETPLDIHLGTFTNTKFTVPSPVQGVDFDDPQVTKWRLYMTVAGGAAFRFVDETDIGTPLVVDLTDTTLAARTPCEFFVNDPPPGFAVSLAEHRGQVAGVFSDDLNLVRFSNLDPDFLVSEGWPADFVQPVAHSDGDFLTALASMGEWLICYKTNSSYAIIGATFAEYVVTPILAAGGGKRTGIGCFCPGVVLQVENAVFFAARDGIYRIDRFEQAYGGLKAERLSGAIDDLYAAAKFSLGASTFFDRSHRIFAFLGHG